MAREVGFFGVLMRGVKRRCPACGEGKLFDGFFGIRDRCDRCGWDFRDPQGDSWTFLYLATGAITGVGIVFLLLFTPKDMELARLLLVPVVAVIFGVTIPLRRGFAIAMNYATRRAFGEL